MKKISIVIPLFNEAACVKALCSELSKMKSQLPSATEVIFVDDGSSDETLHLLKTISISLPKKIISFSRNFGHQSALLAGLREATGEIVITLDGDLQHPLKLIPEFIKLHDQGYDIILTSRIDKQSTTFFKKFSAWFFYSLVNHLSPTSIYLNSSDFRSMNRVALDALLSMPEKNQFLRGMVSWIGYKSIIVPYEVGPRVSGKSKYSLANMIQLALRGLTSFTTAPLYFAIYFSFLLFALAFIYALYVLYVKFFGQAAVEGWASLLLVTLIVGGFLSFFLGLIGLYIAALFEEVKGRPQYLIADKWSST